MWYVGLAGNWTDAWTMQMEFMSMGYAGLIWSSRAKGWRVALCILPLGIFSSLTTYFLLGLTKQSVWTEVVFFWLFKSSICIIYKWQFCGYISEEDVDLGKLFSWRVTVWLKFFLSFPLAFYFLQFYASFSAFFSFHPNSIGHSTASWCRLRYFALST